MECDTKAKEVCKEAIEKGVVEPTDVIDPTYTEYRKAELRNNTIKKLNSKDNTIAPTLTTNSSNFGLTIRKFTPKECWRLMGFDDSDFEKAQKVNSDAQLYKQAGNSIVVNVLEAIFKELLYE